jgi:hypothetical protein
MAIIATPPRGLISLFGIRDMGAVPNDLSNTVVPTIDITEFALVNRETVGFGNVAVNAVGNWALGSTATVPPGEMWYVHSFTLTVNTVGAGFNVRFRPVVWEAGTPFVRGPSVAAAAGESSTTGTDRMFLVTAGQQMQVWVEGITGNATINGYGLISRLRNS